MCVLPLVWDKLSVVVIDSVIRVAIVICALEPCIVATKAHELFIAKRATHGGAVALRAFRRTEPCEVERYMMSLIFVSDCLMAGEGTILCSRASSSSQQGRALIDQPCHHLNHRSPNMMMLSLFRSTPLLCSSPLRRISTLCVAWYWRLLSWLAMLFSPVSEV